MASNCAVIDRLLSVRCGCSPDAVERGASARRRVRRDAAFMYRLNQMIRRPEAREIGAWP